MSTYKDFLYVNNVGHVFYRNGAYLGDVEKDVDGYYYFWFNHGRGGSWGEHHLRMIADLLADMNKEWNAQFREEMSSDERL